MKSKFTKIGVMTFGSIFLAVSSMAIPLQGLGGIAGNGLRFGTAAKGLLQGGRSLGAAGAATRTFAAPQAARTIGSAPRAFNAPRATAPIAPRNARFAAPVPYTTPSPWRGPGPYWRHRDNWDDFGWFAAGAVTGAVLAPMFVQGSPYYRTYYYPAPPPPPARVVVVERPPRVVYYAYPEVPAKKDLMSVPQKVVEQNYDDYH